MKIGAAALLSALALGLAACGGGGEEATTASSTPATTAPATPPPADTTAEETPSGKYPEEARDSFLSACTVSAQEEQCECALEYLEKNVPIEELVQAGLESQDGGEMPKVLSDAVAACA